MNRKNEIYITRLWSCQEFREKTVSGRAAVVQSVGGYTLYMDQTRGHQESNCSSINYRGQLHENCLADNQGILCGACHNILLHDSSSNHYSNTLIYSAGNNAVAYNICVKIGKKEDFHDMSCVDIQVSPDVEDIMKANKCKILLPTQWV